MKRGLIAWDQEVIPPAAFENRLNLARKAMEERGLAALVLYTDVWRSNHVRYFSNFMPYWNRALLVIGPEGPPVLLCALSPRVYPWIRSVTIIEEIRPSPNLAQQLSLMCQEKGWDRIGALQFHQFPQDLYAPLAASGLEIDDVPWSAVHPEPEEAELEMFRRSAKLARETLEEQLPRALGMLDHEFVGKLERTLRHAGAEDVVILLSNGDTAPLPPHGATLKGDFSITLAVEYCGHWVRISRAFASSAFLRSLENRLDQELRGLSSANSASRISVDYLSSSYPFESRKLEDVPVGDIFALHVETQANGNRLFFGDTCLRVKNGAELL